MRDAALEPVSGREFIRRQLEPHMLDIAQKLVTLAKGASKTTLAVSEGRFTDERQVEDNDATLRAQDQVHRLLGNYAPSKNTGDGARTIVIKKAVFHLDGTQRVSERIVHQLGHAVKALEAERGDTTGSGEQSVTKSESSAVTRKSRVSKK